MYRAKITHCASIIANLYGKHYPYIVKDDQDIYIEVRNEAEAEIIEAINTKCEQIYLAVATLQTLINK